MGDHDALGCQPRLDVPIELGGVELGELLVGGVDQVDESDVVGRFGVLNVGEGVVVDDLHPGVGQGGVVEVLEQAVTACQLGDVGVDVHDGDVRDAGVAQDLPGQQAVAAAEHEHVGGFLHRGHGTGGQSLVVPGLVQAGELELAVEVQAQVVLVLGEDDLLVGGLLVVDDRVVVGQRLHTALDAVGGCEHADQCHDGGGGRPQDLARCAHLEQDEQCHQDVEGAYQVGPAHEAELWEEHQGEDQGGHQGAEVVDGHDLAEQLAGRAAPEGGEGPHQQRNLQADEDADGQADAAEDDPVQACASEGQVQQEDGVAADEAQEHLADTEDDRRRCTEAVDQQ